MSNVIFVGSFGLGHVLPTIGLVRELVKRGDKVFYLSLPQYKELIEVTGARFCNFICDTHYEITDRTYSYCLKTTKSFDSNFYEQEDYINKFKGYLVNNLKKYKTIKNNVLCLSEKIKPDYIIYDAMSFGAKLAAEKMEVPYICLNTSFAACEKVYEEDPWAILSYDVHSPYTVFLKKDRASKLLNKLNKLCNLAGQEFGIPNFDMLDYRFGKGKLNIVFTSKRFHKYEEYFGDNFKFIGPSIFDRGEQENAFSSEIGNRKLIYISLGSIFNDNFKFYNLCIEAFANTNYFIIMSIGKNSNVDKLRYIPENFIVVDQAPQLSILKRASLFITHGGMNSINESLYYKVPLVVFPQRIDQFFNAKRVEELNVGVYLKEDQVTAKTLKLVCEKLIFDQEVQNRVKNVSRTLRNSEGCKKGVDEIFEFIIKGTCVKY